MITMRTGRRSLLGKPEVGGRKAFVRLPATVALLLAVAITVVVSALHGFLDLRVYRLGTKTWLHHGALYGSMPPVTAGKILLFTYPPQAAVLMTPLAVVPLWLAELMVTATSLGCLGVTVWLVLSRIRPDLEPRTRIAFTTAAGVLLLLTEPVRLTLWFGQVNLVLMAAVALDCLTVAPRWPRGVLIGIAAVTKLFPAAFLLYFLLRKDWKAAATATVTAAAIVATGFLVFPRESRQYWFHAMTDTDRIGAPYFLGNQSIKGMVTRIVTSHTAATALWLGLALVVGCAGAAMMRRLLRFEVAAAPGATTPGAGVVLARPVTLPSVTALLVNALVLLLVSPVSWTHHWVWVGPALLTAVVWVIDHPSRNARIAIAAFTAVFLIGPGFAPAGADRELTWSWWQYIPGDLYVIAGVVLLGSGFVYFLRSSSAQARTRSVPYGRDPVE
jgi:alpha-1,2-mannosyltransferase